MELAYYPDPTHWRVADDDEPPTIDLYEVRCVGQRRANKWTLHLAEACPPLPKMTTRQRGEFKAALRQALEEATGLPTRPFSMEVVTDAT